MARFDAIMSLPSVADQGDTVPKELNDNLTVDELALFLEKKEKIPVVFCQKLKGSRKFTITRVHTC